MKQLKHDRTHNQIDSSNPFSFSYHTWRKNSTEIEFTASQQTIPLFCFSTYMICVFVKNKVGGKTVIIWTFYFEKILLLMIMKPIGNVLRVSNLITETSKLAFRSNIQPSYTPHHDAYCILYVVILLWLVLFQFIASCTKTNHHHLPHRQRNTLKKALLLLASLEDILCFGTAQY